jgi:predicted phage terminase large subunit-like protein
MNGQVISGDTEDLARTVALLRALRRETVRRHVLEDGRLEVLATHILAYEVRPFHQAMLDFQSNAKDACLQLAPRGFGKSSILTIVRSIFEILRDPNVRILIASNTQLQADVFLREIKAHLQHNRLLKEYFGELYSDDKWDSREIFVAPRTSAAKEATITCVGVGGPVASRHYDLILADDLVDEENARTEGQREKVRTWYYKTLLPCLEPDGRLFLVGTRYHYQDLYGHLIKNELAQKHQIIRAIEADGSTPWPEKYSLALLEERREQMGSTVFNTQYQNDVELMKGNMFREEWFRFYEVEPDWDGMEFLIGCDPAATRREALLTGGKRETDWWTIVVGAREYVKGKGYKGPVYLKEAWRGRVTKQAYVDLLKRLKQHYKPYRVMIEAVAAQEYLAQDLEGHMPIERLERSRDKVARAYWLQPFFENGQILFPDKRIAGNWDIWQALMDELLLFPEGEHDDLFDGLQAMVEGAMKPRGGFAGAVIRYNW